MYDNTLGLLNNHKIWVSCHKAKLSCYVLPRTFFLKQLSDNISLYILYIKRTAKNFWGKRFCGNLKITIQDEYVQILQTLWRFYRSALRTLSNLHDGDFIIASSSILDIWQGLKYTNVLCTSCTVYVDCTKWYLQWANFLLAK